MSDQPNHVDQHIATGYDYEICVEVDKFCPGCGYDKHLKLLNEETQNVRWVCPRCNSSWRAANDDDTKSVEFDAVNLGLELFGQRFFVNRLNVPGTRLVINVVGGRFRVFEGNKVVQVAPDGTYIMAFANTDEGTYLETLADAVALVKRVLADTNA